MKVIIALDVSDDLRRKLRGATGRSGLATREDYRDLVQAVIQQVHDTLPEPAPRQRSSPVLEPRQVVDRASRFALAELAPDDAVCAHCRRPKEQHGKMGFSCPPVDGARGKTFEREVA